MGTRRIHAKMKTGGIITLMYNKESCKVCGTYLTSVSLCEVCEEQFHGCVVNVIKCMM